MREAYDAAGIGRSIRALRRERRWTQATLASWLGVSRQTVVALEHGGAVSLPVAMRALGLLGGKVVVTEKDSIIDERRASGD